MRQSSNFNVQVPELGDISDITVVSNAILAGENNVSGHIENLSATFENNVISLTSESRTNPLVRYYKGLAIQFVSPTIIESDSGYRIKIDSLGEQPFATTNSIEQGNVVYAVFGDAGFTANKMGVAVVDDWETQDPKKALSANMGYKLRTLIQQNYNGLNGIKAAKATKMIAGNGLTGGGDLSADRTFTVVAANNGITVSNSGVGLNPVNNLTSTSTTQALTAAQGKALKDALDTTNANLAKEITDRQNGDGGKANNSITITAGNGLTGGGNLTANRTINVVSANDGIVVNADNIQLATVNNLTTNSTTKPLSAAQGQALNNAIGGKANSSVQVIAGNGLTGGGTLTGNVTINIASNNDGISVAADAITLNTVNNLTTNSSTRPLSAAQGQALNNNKLNISGGTITGALTINGTTVHKSLSFVPNGNAWSSYKTDGSQMYLIYADNANRVHIGYQSQYAIFMEGNTTIQGTLNTTGIITSNDDVIAFSDRDVKEDIEPVNTQEAIDNIMKVNMYHFKYKERTEDRVKVGVMADELQSIYPDLVYEIATPTEEDPEHNTLAVAYQGLLLECLSVIQSHERRIRELEEVIKNGIKS